MVTIKRKTTRPETHSRDLAGVAVSPGYPALVRRGAAQRGLLVVGLLWAIGLVLWMLLSPTGGTSSHAEVLALASVLGSLGLIGAKAMSGELGLLVALARLKMGPWVGVGFAIGFGLTTLVWLGDVPAYRNLVQPASLVPGGAVAGGGFAVFTLCYRSTPEILNRGMSRLDRTLRGVGRVSSDPSSVWILWLVAVAALAGSLSSGELGYLADPTAALTATSSSSALLAALAQTGVLATLIAAWRLAVLRSPGSAILLCWVMSTQILVGLFKGSKEAAILQLVAFVVGYSAQRKLKLRTIAASAVITIFIIAPFVTIYRAQLNGVNGRLTPTEALSGVDFSQLISSTLDQNSASGSQSQFLTRWSRIGDVSIIVAQTPSRVPFIAPAELFGGPILGFVPRSIWPGKPVLDAGYQVNQIYYGAPPTVYSSSAVTPYADLYRHGGFPVLVVGMLVLGFFVRTVDSRASENGDGDIRLMFLPMILFTALVKQEVDYLGLSASIVSILLTAAFAVRLVSRK